MIICRKTGPLVLLVLLTILAFGETEKVNQDQKYRASWDHPDNVNELAISIENDCENTYEDAGFVLAVNCDNELPCSYRVLKTGLIAFRGCMDLITIEKTLLGRYLVRGIDINCKVQVKAWSNAMCEDK